MWQPPAPSPPPGACRATLHTGQYMHRHGVAVVIPQPRWGWVCVLRHCPRERLLVVADPWAVVHNPFAVAGCRSSPTGALDSHGRGVGPVIPQPLRGSGVPAIPTGDPDESPGMRPSGRLPWGSVVAGGGTPTWVLESTAPSLDCMARMASGPEGRTERSFDAAPRTTRSHPTPAQPSPRRPSHSASCRRPPRNGRPAARA